jgi:hypothetical protein
MLAAEIPFLMDVAGYTIRCTVIRNALSIFSLNDKSDIDIAGF